jgi:predicted secreted acid phosphatase
MIHLIDGMGQLGIELSKRIPIIYDEMFLYHKWDVWSKDDWNKQMACLKEFCEFVDATLRESKLSTIVFISTQSNKANAYVQTKKLAEKYLFERCKRPIVIALPILIGKGVCEKFREDDSSYPYDGFDIMSIGDAAHDIIDSLIMNPSYGEVIEIDGEYISAKLAKDLIQFGKHGI